jgi:hypothetical protein
MQARGVVLRVVFAALVLTPPVLAAPAMQAYHVVFARRALAAGEQVDVRLEPAPPPGTSIYWRNAQQIGMSPASDGAARAVFTAPFVIPTGTPAAEIRVDLSGAQTGRVGFVGRIDLVPSAVPGSGDCLAPGQSYSVDHGTLEPEGPPILRAEAVIVHMSDAEYPKSAVSRNLTDIVPLSVLLCASGRVLAAYPLTSYGDNGLPIEHDRILTDAAMTIARSRTFAPLLSDNTPIAGWIHVQVAFRP